MTTKEAIKGAIAIVDGFGKEPPSQEVAQARANACLTGMDGQKCRYNYLGGWIVNTNVAMAIHKMRELKNQMKLEVQNEQKLGTCEICKCVLPLKVWYDFETIFSHTTDETFLKFPPWCWMKQEWLQRKQQTPQ